MAGSAQADAAEAVSARRVGDDRDFDREAHASTLYFDLRVLTREQLADLAREFGGDSSMGRQVLIGLIIDGCFPAVGEIGYERTHQPKEER